MTERATLRPVAGGAKRSPAGGFEVGYESWLERDHLMLLDFDPAVVAVASQPFWPFWTGEQGKARSHAPDYFARLAGGGALVLDCRPVERCGHGWPAHRHAGTSVFSTTAEYDDKGSLWFDYMVRDFFKFLADEPDKDYYLALGSNQRVTVKKPFQPKAKKAYNRFVEAIANEGKASANKKWRVVFGKAVPLDATKSARSFRDTEGFIENLFPVDIGRSVTIDCEVTQNGWRPTCCG